MRHPRLAFETFRRYVNSPILNKDERNFHELIRPVLEWSNTFGGNLHGIVRAHHKNYQEALSRFGKIDLIHAHVSYPAGWAAMQLSKHTGVPFVLTEHMGPFPPEIPRFILQGKLTRWLENPLKSAEATIAVSPSLANRISSFGLPLPIVIPNVVDERRFQLRKRDSTNRPFTFFTLCGITPEKGIPELLQAIKLALVNEPNLHFKIGGAGEYLDEYVQLSAELGLSRVVEWLGPVDRERVPDQYMGSDAFIMVSHHETFGVVYAEAIACGLPIIATRCGGPEFIVNQNNGVLVDVGNIAEIAKAIVGVYRGYSRFNAGAIREDFMARFSRKTVVDQLSKCYSAVLSNDSGTKSAGAHQA